MKKMIIVGFAAALIGSEMGSLLAQQYDVNVETNVSVNMAEADTAAKINVATLTLDSCSVHFSPRDGTIAALVGYIGMANKSIRVLAYSFTSADISNALIEARKRGVDVQVVLDRSVPTEKNSMLPKILNAGIPALIDKTHKIAHSKVILVDDEWIETGSFDYTENAENFNGENALICHGKEAHDLYLSDWNRHKAHSISAN